MSVKKDAKLLMSYTPTVARAIMGQERYDAAASFVKEHGAELSKIVAPQMNGADVVGSNTLGQDTSTFWRLVAEPVAEKYSKRLASLTALAKNVLSAMPSFEQGLQPAFKLPVIDGAGTAIKNCTNWKQSAVADHYVDITLDRYSRPFGLSSYSLANGENPAWFIDAAYKAIEQALFGVIISAIAAKVPTLTGENIPATDTTAGVLHIANTNAFTPEYVAHTVATVFGDVGDVESLVLNADLYARLQMTNAQGLPIQDGQYGIGSFSRSALLNGLDGSTTGMGVALRNQAVAMIAAPVEIVGDCQVVTLPPIAGIPVKLKIWYDNDGEKVWHSVEALFGAAVTDPEGIAVISTGSAPEPSAPEGDQPAA